MEQIFFKKLDNFVTTKKDETNILNDLTKVLLLSPRVNEIFDVNNDAIKTFTTLKEELSDGINKQDLKDIILDFDNILAAYISDDDFNLNRFDKKGNKAVFSFIKGNEDKIDEKLQYLEDLLNKDCFSQDELLEILILIDCHLALLLFCSNVMVVLDYSEKQNQALNALFKDEHLYYRGHSNERYNFIPSIYRNLMIKDSVLDSGSLESIYRSRGIVNKYCEIFSGKPFSLDYKFLAYVQHSCAYSPFLDFTSDEDTARIFATHELNYNSGNAALFAFYPYPQGVEKNMDNALSKFKVSFHEKKLTYKSKVFDKPICLCTLDDFTPLFAFNDEQCNDRMKYQKGSFLFIYKCVIANGRICMTFGAGFILKMVIKKKYRNGMYNKIVRSRPYLEYRYLLDPYLYLSECNRKAKRVRRKKGVGIEKP